MRTRKEKETVNEVRLFGAAELCDYLGLGKNKAIEFAESVGAKRKIGKRTLFDKTVIDRALDAMMSEYGQVNGN